MTDKTKFNIKATLVVVGILILLYVFLGVGRNDSTPAPQDGTTEVQPQQQ